MYEENEDTKIDSEEQEQTTIEEKPQAYKPYNQKTEENVKDDEDFDTPSFLRKIKDY